MRRAPPMRRAGRAASSRQAIRARSAGGSPPRWAQSTRSATCRWWRSAATAVRHRIPIVMILFNDGAYGNVRNMQRKDHGNRVIGSDLANPDFMRLADSFGIAGQRVAGPEALRQALELALTRNEPTLIEVPCGDMPDPWRFIDMP